VISCGNKPERPEKAEKIDERLFTHFTLKFQINDTRFDYLVD